MLEHENTPAFTAELGSLTNRIRALEDNTGLLPDLLGPNNIMLVAADQQPKIQIVDTIPDTPEKLDQYDSLWQMTRREAIADILSRWELAFSA